MLGSQNDDDGDDEVRPPKEKGCRAAWWGRRLFGLVAVCHLIFLCTLRLYFFPALLLFVTSV